MSGYAFTPERIAHHRGIVLAAHRPVPFCHGDVAKHADGCAKVKDDDAWYITFDAGDAPSGVGVPSELLAAYCGPACVTPEWAKHGLCVGCSYSQGGSALGEHNNGPVAWPCSYVIALGGPS